MFEQGRAPATAALGVAAVTFRATLAGTPVRGPQTDRVLAGFRRDGADRGRGHAEHLEQAIVAYRAALQERTRERVPLAWATTQTNLGRAIQIPRERGRTL